MRKNIAKLLVASMVVTMLSGCNKAQTTNKPAVDTKKPVTLKIYRPANIVDPEKDPILLAVQKKLNVKVEIVTVPWDQEVNTLNLKMSSKEEIDIIQAETANTWVKWAKEDLVYNIGDLIKGKEKDYSFINSIINAESFKGLKVDGKAYYIPGSHHGQDWGMFVRQDWLDKLGLKQPKTTDELYDVLKAFKEKDPDGNGKADTIGYQATMPAADNFGDFDPIMHAFGGSFGGFFEDYVIRDGKVVPLETTNDTKAGFQFINKLYREGLINADFASTKNVDEANAKYLYANKAGMLWTSRPAEFEENIKKGAAKGALEFMSPVNSAPNKFIKTQGMAWWMLLGIPKTCKNPETALKFIEYINSEEGRKLMVAGVQGKDYTTITADGVYDRNKVNWEKDYDVKANGYDNPLWFGFLSTVHGYIPVTKYSTFEEAIKNEVMLLSAEDAKKKFNWKTAVKYGAEYNEPNQFHAVMIDEVAPLRNKIQNDVKAVYFLKMITAKNEGEVNKLWDEYLKAWSNAGGDKVITAYQDFYDKNLKK